MTGEPTQDDIDKAEDDALVAEEELEGVQPHPGNVPPDEGDGEVAEKDKPDAAS